MSFEGSKGMRYILRNILALCVLLIFCHQISADQATLSKPKDKDACVILLHGLARTNSSMNKMEDKLTEAGYHVVNMDYPSRKHDIDALAYMVIPKAIQLCKQQKYKQIHFVTHSMGGILLRYYLAKHKINNLGRTVMLSPPNQGSEVVDKIGDMPGFYALNGPAGMQLNTGNDSIPANLPAVNFELGVITGSRSINLILSTMIPGDDDGKVSIESAKVEGMSDFLIMPVSHPFIMKDNDVIRQVKHFLKHGKFYHDEEGRFGP
jgi:triacylglycerol esterase/lipase EstA (alpha/beta hydrolase family)